MAENNIPLTISKNKEMYEHYKKAEKIVKDNLKNENIEESNRREGKKILSHQINCICAAIKHQCV